MAILLAIPVLGLLIILQSAILSQVHLLKGTADVVMVVVVAWAIQERVKTAWHWAAIAGLLVSIVSALPAAALLLCYLGATAAARLLRRAFWQRPLFAMIAATAVGTLLSHAIAYIWLRVSGAPLPLLGSLDLITLPSILLNLILALPVYALMGDLASWIYPEEIEL